VSKNVAVFVDVANIFYAAKAAGVDIDYVTLLKSATSGRDFVRAYAYTGLDPENDNQRNFHEFLKRSGYKVVSKDIRKYGDGRIKANLDIELVVDLMRMAQHIDIAVVISGDGDFAPAIRAVQQMGVRVEVISFRGNTSSDLIEVADVFTDISHIARVEKGARSGRRIAAEDDLSMTEVPDKETDLGPRRRRGGGRRDGRDEGRAARPVAVVAAGDTGLPGNVIVLPGERLSRAAGVAAEEPGELEEAGEAFAGAPGEEEQGEGRRRRRRRGGRGRGRGRRAEGEVEVGTAEEPALEGEDEEMLEEELAPLPQHSTFGSVWDSQIGLPSQPVTPVEGEDEDEEYEDEPEIPEYLLAERRQQGQRRDRGNRVRGGRGGRAGGYQSAIDRERFGRGGTSSFGGVNRMPAGRPQGSGGGRPGGQQPPRRPQQPAPREVAPRETAHAQGSSEPWSEVPPEVQELLRAELAKRQAARPSAPARPAQARGGSPARGSAVAAPEAAPAEPAALATEPAGTAETPRRATRRRTTRAPEAPVEGVAEVGSEVTPGSTAAPAEAAAEAPKRTTRRRTSRSADAAAEPTAAPQVAPEAPTEAAAAPKRTTRRRTAQPAAEAAPEAAAAAEAQGAVEAKPKRARRKAATVAPEGTDDGGTGPTEA
jgi:uncharacterized LabA/DUF88 family protein